MANNQMTFGYYNINAPYTSARRLLIAMGMDRSPERTASAEDAQGGVGVQLEWPCISGGNAKQ